MRRRRRFGLYAALILAVGSAIASAPLFVSNFAGPWQRDRLAVQDAASGVSEGGFQKAEPKAWREDGSQTNGLSSPSIDSRDAARIEIAQLAQELVTEQMYALEQERQRGDALARELASAREELKALKAAANRDAEARTQALKDTEHGLETARAELARLEQEQAEVGRRLEETRRQEAQGLEELAAITHESASKASTLAEAEQRLQQARENEAAVQNQLASLWQKREQLSASVHGAQARLTQLQQEMAKLNQDMAAAQQELAQVQNKRAGAQRRMSAGQGSGAGQTRPNPRDFFFGR